MITEMESKFALTSELLINDLTLRDKLVFGLSVKNKFISALLQVQALRHSNTLSTPSKLESVGRALTSRKSAEDKANFRVRFLLTLSTHAREGYSSHSLCNYRHNGIAVSHMLMCYVPMCKLHKVHTSCTCATASLL